MNNDSKPKQKYLELANKKQIIEVARQLGNTWEAARRYNINETDSKANRQTA